MDLTFGPYMTFKAAQMRLLRHMREETLRNRVRSLV
jgi:hypothetical protein